MKKKKKKSNNKPVKILKRGSPNNGESAALPTVDVHLSPEDRRELRGLRGLHLSTVAHWPKRTRDRAQRTLVKDVEAPPKKKRRQTAASSKTAEYLAKPPPTDPHLDPWDD